MSHGFDIANNLAGAAALVNGLILWPIVRSLQRAVNELKRGREDARAVRTSRTRRRRKH
jgi:hypothetical protein